MSDKPHLTFNTWEDLIYALMGHRDKCVPPAYLTEQLILQDKEEKHLHFEAGESKDILTVVWRINEWRTCYQRGLKLKEEQSKNNKKGEILSRVRVKILAGIRAKVGGSDQTNGLMADAMLALRNSEMVMMLYKVDIKSEMEELKNV